MFTGIVEEIGSVRSCRRSGSGFDLVINAQLVTEDAHLGDSIAVNGVCLTVTALDDQGFTTGLAPETLSRTNLESLPVAGSVNLERALLPTTRMGGHFVQGHVDGTGSISRFDIDNDALWVTIKAPESIMPYVVPKGYITLDGTSLTVVEVGDDWFNVTLVAYTQQHIILPKKAIGDAVNIEVDVLGKYVERLLQFGTVTSRASPLTHDFLKENGYD